MSSATLHVARLWQPSALAVVLFVRTLGIQVLGWPDGQKQDAVAGIVAWYEQQGIRIADEDVYFFGDRTENIPPFGSTSFNAREISCVSRDMGIGNGIVGYCGATVVSRQQLACFSSCSLNRTTRFSCNSCASRKPVAG